MRNNVSNFENIYKSFIVFFDNNKIDIPITRQRKMSTKTDCSSHIQYLFNENKDEMRKVYYTTLDNMISTLNIRFN